MTIAVTIATTVLGKLARGAERGNLRNVGRALDYSFSAIAALESNINVVGGQVKVGSVAGAASSVSVTIQTNWNPTAVFLYRVAGSAVYVGANALGSGKAVYIRGNAAVPQSMGLISSEGITLSSNGFALGTGISVAKSFGYVAFKSGP